MSVTEIHQLSDLFRKAGQAHHRAFIRTNGEDPEWPLWYAEYLLPRLKPYLARSVSNSELVCWLIQTEKDRAVADWPTVYAMRLLEDYGREATIEG
ncbi:MAG: hypothetical protein C4331_07140 [Meiothermus sp.]